MLSKFIFIVALVVGPTSKVVRPDTPKATEEIKESIEPIQTTPKATAKPTETITASTVRTAPNTTAKPSTEGELYSNHQGQILAHHASEQIP